jgi:gliding motility-associated-like protein
MKQTATLYSLFGFLKQYYYFLIAILFFFLSPTGTFAQTMFCEASIEPFCSGNEAYIFPNCNSTNVDCTEEAEEGPDYGCLFSQPWPAWFYLQIDEPGDLDFEIVQNTAFDGNGNPTGNDLDVDFIAWGPFAQGDDLCDYDQLQPFNEIGCSFSPAPIENFSIPNTLTGDIYVLLITNYNQSAGFIKLVQTGGTGTTNCEIIFTCNVEIDGGDQVFCDVTETTLTTTTNGPVQSYRWYLNGTEITGETNDSLTVSESGVYKVVADGVDCDQAVEDEVNISIPGLIAVDLGTDQEFCDVTSFEIIPTIVGNNSNANYLWSNGETTPTIVVNTTGNYSVAIIAESCEVTDSVLLLFGETPLFDLGEDIETCFENDIVLDATPSNMDPNDVTYLWSTGATSPSIIVTEIGNYSVMASFGNCEVENSITISGRTDLNVSVNDDFKSCLGEEWTLTANTSEEEVNYQWYLNEDLIVGETNSTITFVVGDNFSGNENYSVVISRGTCLGTDDVNIELYNVSNCVITQGISPDATPEFNDYLDLEFLSDRVGGITNLQIFNRYGTIVFNKNNYINEWKGQDKNGNDLPTGTYYYVIDFASADDVYGPQTSGWIYLNRTGN